MAEYCTVTANFLTMQERGGAPVPVSGRVEFTPTAHAYSSDSVFTQAARTGYVVGGVLYDSPDAKTAGVRLVAPSPGVSPERFGYKVTAHLRDGEGRPAPYPCGFIHPTAGGVLNLAEQAPVPDPGSPSGWSARGPRGEVGPPGVQGERGLPGPQGDPGPKGADGVGVPQKLSIAGSELTLSPDGGTVTLPSTDLSSLVSRADALARRVEALEARPQGGGGGGAVQDTGVRLLETISESGGLCDVLIRRVGSVVQAWMVTTNPERKHGSLGPQFTKQNVVLESKTLPKGFLPALGVLPNYPERRGDPRYSHDNRFAVSAIVTSNIGNGQPYQVGTLGFFTWFNNLVMRLDRNTNRAVMGSLTWTTTDAWPAVLPGTAYEG